MIKIKSDVKKTCAKGLLSIAMVVITEASIASTVSATAISYNYAGQYDSQTLSGSAVPIEALSAATSSGATATSVAYANYGILKISGSALAFPGVNSVYPNATSYAQARWTDNMTIAANGFTGNAFVVANILLRGELVAGIGQGGGASAYADLTINSDNLAFDARSAVGVTTGHHTHTHSWTMTSGNETLSGFDAMFRMYTLNIPIQLGTSFGLDIMLRGGASATASYDPTFGEGTFDLGHSLYWAGISELHDTNGNLIADYSLVSDSGMNYRQSLVPASAVPIPATIWLFLSGVLALGSAKRHSFKKIA